MTEASEPTGLSTQSEFLESTRGLLEQVRAQLVEIRMLIEQSQGEVDKLANRNANITSRLHQLHANFETVPREDIRETYDAAQDAQQRLFTMSGQLEKLKSDQGHLEKYAAFLARTEQFLQGPPISDDALSQAGGLAGFQQIIEAQEDERYKISRQIHDGPAQSLSNFILQAEIAMRLMDRDQEAARQEMANLKKAASETFSQIRSFIFDLRPMMLDDLGLVPTLRRYVDVLKEDSGMEIELVITGTEGRIGQHMEVLMFRGIQELLKAAREHAQATHVKAMLDISDKQVRASVEDNGTGIDEDGLASEDVRSRGLRALEKRIQQAGGSLDIETRPGHGTRVAFTIQSSAQPD